MLLVLFWFLVLITDISVCVDPPSVPTGLLAKTYTSSQINLTWVKGVNATHTVIERNTTNDWSRGHGTEIYNGTGTNYEDAGLTSDTVYYYQVWSYNDTSKFYSANNDSANNYTVVLSTVTTNASTGMEETNATLRGYLDDDGGESCNVSFQYGVTASYGSWTSNQSNNTGEEFDINQIGLSNGTFYHYRAVANNTRGISYGSDTTFLTKPQAPTSLSASTFNDSRIDLSWSKSDTNANNTVVERNSSKGDFILITTQMDGTGNYHGVWKYGNYIYTACDTGGIRAYSFDGSSFSLLDTQDDGNNYISIWSNNSYVYAACGVGGVRAYSFDGSDFTLLDEDSDGLSNYYDVWGDDNYIYISCAAAGIYGYSFDGSSFTLEDTQDDGGSYLDAWGDDNYIYTACGIDGVRAYSFDGSSFTLEDTQDDGGIYYGVWGDDNYIYTACDNNGIRAYSFDGSSFTLEDTQDDGSGYYDIWGDDNYLYVGCQDEGIRAYTFNGTNFTLEDAQDDGGTYYRLWSNNSYIFTSCREDGLRAYKLGWPRESGTEIYNSTSTSYSDTGLTSDTVYYYQIWGCRIWGGLYSYSDDYSSASTSTHPELGLPSSIVIFPVNDTVMSISWVSGTNASHTIIERNTSTSGSVWSRGSGTEIYNNTGISYTNTDLSISTNFTYRFWSYNDTNKFYTGSNNSGYNWTYPSNPSITDIVVDNTYLNFTWANGTGCDTTLILQKANSYPTGETDGTVIYNNTLPEHSKTSFNLTDYFTLYTYNDSSKYYSTGVDGSWGALLIYVYKENEPWIEIGNYTVFISNNDASSTYYETDVNNPLGVDVDDIPYGDNTIIQISKEGYKTRTKIKDFDVDTNYNISFYLPPSGEGSPDDEQDEPWYIPAKGVLIIDIESVDDYTTDETISLECSPDDVEAVYIYNSSIYGGWISCPDDKYSLSGSTLTVNKTVLDTNSSMIRVEYYCDSDEEYSSHYIVTVEDDAGQSIEDAFFEIQRYMNNTDTYSTVFSDYTDSSGQVEMDLIADSIYYVIINKTGYDNTTTFWSPPSISQWEDSQKTFILYAEAANYTDETSYADCISLTGEYNLTTGFVNFSWGGTNCGSLHNFSIWVYCINITTNQSSYRYSYNDSMNSSVDVTFDIYDLNNTFEVQVYLNTTVFGSHWVNPPIYINPSHSDAHSNYSYISTEHFDSLLDNILGENSIAWSALFGIFVLMACLFAFGQQNAGLGLVLCGMVMLGFNALFGLALLSVSLCIIIVVFGILVQWRMERRTA